MSRMNFGGRAPRPDLSRKIDPEDKIPGLLANLEESITAAKAEHAALAKAKKNHPSNGLSQANIDQLVQEHHAGMTVELLALRWGHPAEMIERALINRGALRR